MNLKTIAGWPFEVKSVDEDGTFEGHAAVFGNVDAYGDIIEPGAFVKTIAERPVVPILWQHDPYEPIGKSIELAEDAMGLAISGRILGDVTRGKDALTLMRAGVVSGLSIGYQTVKYEIERRDDNVLRHLKEIKLWEFSPVTFPANELAQVSAIKSFIDALRKGDLSDDVLRILTEADGHGSAPEPDLKEGRVLSSASRTLVEQAIEALQALLTAADGSTADEEAAKGSEQPEAADGITPDDVTTARDALRSLFNS
jgi:HK97 family phage prohead protease